MYIYDIYDICVYVRYGGVAKEAELGDAPLVEALLRFHAQPGTLAAQDITWEARERRSGGWEEKWGGG